MVKIEITVVPLTAKEVWEYATRVLTANTNLNDPSEADIWAHATRTLTQTQFPFWSAVITQAQGLITTSAGATLFVDVQPPAGETWWVEFAGLLPGTAGQNRVVKYYDYDGASRRLHALLARTETSLDTVGLSGVLTRVLTSTLYGSLSFYSSLSEPGYYGYSGFKLSKPWWSPVRTNNPEPKPWKRPKTRPLPPAIEALDKYAFDILGVNPERPEEYDLGVILEEDTPLATDPDTGFVVERLTACVQADVLAALIAEFKAGTKDPVETGYRKYLDKWKAEGIDLGV